MSEKGEEDMLYSYKAFFLKENCKKKYKVHDYIQKQKLNAFNDQKNYTS